MRGLPKAYVGAECDGRRVGGLGDVAVGRVHANATDRLRLTQPAVLPRRGAIGRLVDAITLHDVAAQLHFTHADVNDIGIRLAHADRADR